jgi:hypothetical protein
MEIAAMIERIRIAAIALNLDRVAFALFDRSIARPRLVPVYVHRAPRPQYLRLPDRRR